jgi:hypothetical protein
MPRCAAGDFVKADFAEEKTGESEWMWVQVERSDDDEPLTFGRLDNEPVAFTKLSLGQEIVVSYDLGREHRRATSFGSTACGTS